MFEALEEISDIRKTFDFLKNNKLYIHARAYNLYQTLIPFYGTNYYNDYNMYYTKNIHGRTTPIFINKDVESLYNVTYRFRNEYEDDINKAVLELNQAIIEENRNDLKSDLFFLMKCQYVVFEYFLIMAEQYGICDYDIFRSSMVCKYLDIILKNVLKKGK